MTDQRHMTREEFEEFIEVYRKALVESDIYPPNEARELELRSLATYMWDAGKRWQKAI